MCFALPSKVLKIKEQKAVFEANGTRQEADLSLLPNVKIGDYILIQNKMAVKKVAKKEAEKILEMIEKAASNK